MRTFRPIGLAALAAVLIGGWAGHALAQPGRDPGRRGARNYDPNTVVTVTGDITSVTRVAMGGGMGPGVHLTLKTPKENLDVHLGPSWYLDEQTPKLKAGDRITVTGSQVTFQGKPALIAAEVKRGEARLKLRDVRTGVPQWSGGRDRGRGRGPAGG